jgi:hypothetical protein
MSETYYFHKISLQTPVTRWQTSTSLHGNKIQKPAIFILAAVRIWNLTPFLIFGRLVDMYTAPLHGTVMKILND